MKKQINPSIKAHLLRSALILLSLLAICAIPFALAQRNTAKSSVRPAYGTTRSDAPFPQPQTALFPQRPEVCTLNGTLGTAPAGGGTGSIATRLVQPLRPTVMCGIAPTWPGNTGGPSFIYNVHYITNSGASPVCTSVALHLLLPLGLPVTNVQCSAFRAPFAAGDITNQTRYLGDAGVSTSDPLFIPVFQLTIPVGTTIALVVFNVNPFPAGQGAPYELLLDQDIFCQQGGPSPTGTPSPGASGTPCRPIPGVCTPYEASSTQNTLEGSAIVLDCPTCSNGAKVSYVGSNDGTLQFNGVGAIASGSYTMTICYLNGDAVRYAYLSVNGGPGMPVSFPSTGSFHTVGSIQRTVTLNTGCNTLKFYNPIVGSWAPDFDSIRFNCPDCGLPTPTPTPTATATPTPTPTPAPTGVPGVTTSSATNVASSTATLNGTVNPRGLATTVHFQYGTTTSYGSTTGSQSKTGNTFQAVSANISGLTASTIYHFRIVATNSAGTVYGADRTFTTLSATGPPVVITNPATFIASFSARLNGSVDPHGLGTSVYFQCGTTTSYGLSTSPQSKTGNTYQNVAAGISGLSASTTYHFRIVATNSAGTTYGTDQIFTTLSATGPPMVIANGATNVTSSTATLNAAVDPHGLTTSVHFQYGTTTSYGSTTPSQIKTGNTYGTASANISGLNASTTYHFRVVATNSAGITYGSDRTFTTP